MIATRHSDMKIINHAPLPLTRYVGRPGCPEHSLALIVKAARAIPDIGILNHVTGAFARPRFADESAVTRNSRVSQLARDKANPAGI